MARPEQSSSSICDRHDRPTGEFHANVRVESVLFDQLRARALHVAIIEGQTEFTYADLCTRARAFADRLDAADVVPGDRVPIYLDKNLDYVVALYGAWIVGAIAIPVNETLTCSQVLHIIEDSGSRVLVSSAARLRRTKMPELSGIVVLDVENHVAASPSPAPAAPREGGAEPAAILYTSGSTGKPKGIVLSHANLVTGSDIVTDYLGIEAVDRVISILPFGFDYGLNQLLGCVYRGAALVLQRSHFPADICRTLLGLEITVMAAVPPLWIQLAQRHSPFLRTDFPSLRLITNTGGVFPVDLIRTFRKAHPSLQICLMYGLTEAFRSTYLPPEQVDIRPNSIGIPIPQTEVHVLDEQLRKCPPGVEGELVHRGPTVALGYWQAPEATAATFRSCPQITGNDIERVVFSGDLAYRDEEGYLYFSGRRDQLIKSLGYRVSADEIEELLLACDVIAEVAVTSEPDPERGAAIIAHVVSSDPGVTETQLAAYARRAMPTYMQPKRFVLRANLPKTSSGKINREDL